MATLTIEQIRRRALAALEEQSFVGSNGVLGLPVSSDGYQWDGNTDVTVIVQAIREAVVLSWSPGVLEVIGRYEPRARYFRLFGPGKAGETARIQAYNTPQNAVGWEVIAPDGVVLLSVTDSQVDLADAVYRHAPAGSRLVPIPPLSPEAVSGTPVTAGRVAAA